VRWSHPGFRRVCADGMDAPCCINAQRSDRGTCIRVFGLAFAAKLTIVTTLVSGIFLGLGLHIFFQILAWLVICLLTDLIAGIYRPKEKMPPILVMAIFAALMGYVFGFVVSLEKLMIGGPTMFWTYYLSGLSFDTLHAIGNFVFYLICAPIMIKTFIRGSKSLQK